MLVFFDVVWFDGGVYDVGGFLFLGGYLYWYV